MVVEYSVNRETHTRGFHQHLEWLPRVPEKIKEFTVVIMKRRHGISNQEILIPHQVQVWQVHDVIKDAFGYLDRNRIALSTQIGSDFRVLDFDEVAPQAVYFHCWPAPYFPREGVKVPVYYENKRSLRNMSTGSVELWNTVTVPENYTPDDVWAAIVTKDPFALDNFMRLCIRDNKYYVTWVSWGK